MLAIHSRQQADILAGGEAAALVAAAVEQKIAGTLPARRKVLVDRLARLLGDLEPDRKTGLVLPNGRTVEGIAMWRDVLDLEAHHIAATQLAVDREIEDRDALRAALHLGLAIGSDEGGAASSARDELNRLLSAQERIAATQTWPAELGYDVGPADGLAGPGTQTAIARFAEDRGVAPAPADSADLIARIAPLVRR